MHILSTQFPLNEQLFKQKRMEQSSPINPALQRHVPSFKHFPLGYLQSFGQILSWHDSPVKPDLQKQFPFLHTLSFSHFTGHDFISHDTPSHPAKQITSPLLFIYPIKFYQLYNDFTIHYKS